jgi:hypothetical protein
MGFVAQFAHQFLNLNLFSVVLAMTAGLILNSTTTSFYLKGMICTVNFYKILRKISFEVEMIDIPTGTKEHREYPFTFSSQVCWFVSNLCCL